ncbi:MAG: hypothetical protein ACE5EK_06300 [Nitrospinales bacterium]
MSDEGTEKVTVQTCNATHQGVTNQFQHIGIEVRDMKDDIKTIHSRNFTIVLMVGLALLAIFGNIVVTIIK